MHEDKPNCKYITEDRYKDYDIEISRVDGGVVKMVINDNDYYGWQHPKFVFPTDLTMLEYHTNSDRYYDDIEFPASLHTLKIKSAKFCSGIYNITLPLSLHTLKLTNFTVKTTTVLPPNLCVLIVNKQSLYTHVDSYAKFVLPLPRTLRTLCLPLFDSDSLDNLPSELEELIIVCMTRNMKQNITNLPITLKKIMVLGVLYYDYVVNKITKIPYGCEIVKVGSEYYDTL
ncbi:MAG: hypothetical protein Gaeavirus7_14 [Gaeavirus sp.]|uniref:FNIP repeat-containing protein n=1 Tax=Gaeavirus sp. TaxID=2487767 RepID=A0A3G4ZYR1_9VIRU|nr:MAG: hypothetical protein Gaeavirus7_14 [Gaeavirus sp.]